MKFKTNIYSATFYQFFIFLLFFWLTRVFFFLYNLPFFPDISFSYLIKIMFLGLPFDLSGALYFNLLFLLMRFLPAPFTYNRIYLKVTDWIYYITNSFAIVLNLGDSIFYQFNNSRLRFYTLMEYVKDSNFHGIIMRYFIDYWWAVLAGILYISFMIFLYKRVIIENTVKDISKVKLYTRKWVLFLILGFGVFLGIRGHLRPEHPIAIDDAIHGTKNNCDLNIVLNTPFSILRSSRKGNELKEYNFYTPGELDKIRTSLHSPNGSQNNKRSKKNIVIIILEGIGQMYLDSVNPIEEARGEGLMPFLDSLCNVSLVPVNTYATGKSSIGGTTAVIGGFPSFGNFKYMVSPYNANIIDSFSNILDVDGYNSVFYGGGNKGSVSLEATIHAFGITKFIDREKFGNDKYFDNYWGIFDHAMAKYIADDLSNTKEPFFAGWTTLSSHSPFIIPDYYGAHYKNKEQGVDRAVEYVDESLREFFDYAKTMKWYDNTIFIITSDHGTRDKRANHINRFTEPRIPMIIFAPDRSIKPQKITRVMAQYDLLPTVLSLINHSGAYVCMGNSLFDDDVPHYAINYIDNQFQIISEDLMVEFDAEKDVIGKVYDIKNDYLLRHPLESYDKSRVDSMHVYIKAFLQDYNHRMINNKMSIVTTSNSK